MANPAFVQQVATNASGFVGSVTSAAFGTTPTTGNAILVLIVTESDALDVTGVSNSGTANTYTRIASKLNTGGSPSIEAWLAQNITGSASMTVTVTDSGFVIGGFVAMEISGIPTGNVVDNATGAINGFVSPISTTASGATTNANDILIYAAAEAAAGSTMSAGALGGSTGANFAHVSNSSTATAMGTETQVVAATGTYSGAIGSTTTNAGDTGLLIALSNTAIVGASGPVAYGLKINQAVKRSRVW